MSEIFVDTIRKTGGSLGTDIRVKNTSVYESDGGTSVTKNLVQSLTKVWCSADENTSVVIRDSFNTASLTDNSAGNTSFSFTSAMDNTSFSGVGTSSAEGSVTSYDVQVEVSASRTSSLYRLLSVNYSNGSNNDSEFKNIQICGDLA